MKNVKTATKKQRTANANLVASVVVSLDRCMFYYGRHADTVFEGLEQIGGFYESIHFIGFIFVFFFINDRLKRYKKHWTIDCGGTGWFVLFWYFIV